MYVSTIFKSEKHFRSVRISYHIFKNYAVEFIQMLVFSISYYDVNYLS